LSLVVAAHAQEQKIFSRPGTYEYTAPADATTLDVTCIGGGGSGEEWEESDGDDCIFEKRCPAGGPGARIRASFPAPRETIKITIGAGGHDGLPGGKSSFGDFVVALGGGSRKGHGSPGGDGACVVKENRAP
jgi:hypothetical protein